MNLLFYIYAIGYSTQFMRRALHLHVYGSRQFLTRGCITSSVWLDTRDVSSWDRNPADFTYPRAIVILGVSEGIFSVNTFFHICYRLPYIKNKHLDTLYRINSCDERRLETNFHLKNRELFIT